MNNKQGHEAARKNAGGGGGDVKRTVALDTRPTAPAARTGASASKACPRCGNGELRPDSDGNGGLVDRCSNCGSVPTASDRARAERVVAAGRPCPTEGCSGRLNANGACEFCERRAKWLAEHIPPVLCEICTAAIPEPARSQKYCAACKPLRARWHGRQAKERMAKKKK